MMKYHRRYIDDREQHRRWVDPRLWSVRVADIQAYLTQKGWKSVDPDRPCVIVFQEPTVGEDGPLYQWVPDSEDYGDYSVRVWELIAALGAIEDRSAGEVLTDILQARNHQGTNGSEVGGVEAASPQKERPTKLRGPWIDPRVLQVRPAGARAYLVQHGWHNAGPAENPDLLLFDGPGDGQDAPAVLLPPHTKEGAYVQRMIDLIAEVAVFEGRYAGDVLTDVLAAQSAGATNGAGQPHAADAETTAP